MRNETNGSNDNYCIWLFDGRLYVEISLYIASVFGYLSCLWRRATFSLFDFYHGGKVTF